MQPQCLCGQAINLPIDRKHGRCRNCGVPWEQDFDGVWSLGISRTVFTPFYTNSEEYTVTGQSIGQRNKPKRRKGRHRKKRHGKGRRIA